MLDGQLIHRYKEKGVEGLKMGFACYELVCGHVSSLFTPVRGMVDDCCGLEGNC